MEVRQAIHDLHFSLEHTIAEDELVGVIADRLPALRKAYPSYRSSFAPDDIDFLKSLGVIWKVLQVFIELKEELASVSDLKEYDEMDSRLTQALAPLAHYPVGRRIAKELRGLKERLPAIREQDEARQQDRRNVRILDFQPRQCPRHHPMVVREGSRGYFWGCTSYPFCSATGQLTHEENDLLTP